MQKLGLLLPLLLLACPAVAQFAVTLSDTGAVNVDVDGVRCLDTYQVILPSPDWRGGAGPGRCVRQDLGPNHQRVTTVMGDGTPCADLALDVRTGGEAVDLAWEVRFTRDLDVETVRLNGYLPCAQSAGRGAWFISRPGQLRWSLFPARLGQPGGELRDWGYDWFGYMLPGDRGLRFTAPQGISDAYIQDGRQWGDDKFQTCWTLADKGTVKGGTVLRAAMRIERLRAEAVRMEAERDHVSLLTSSASLHEAPNGRVAGQVVLHNVQATPCPLRVQWAFRDDLGAVLARGSQQVLIPPVGSAEVPVAGPGGSSGDCRLHAVAQADDGSRTECEARYTGTPPGPRSRLSLDGAWALCPAAPDEQAPAADAAWTSTTVPAVIPDSPYRHWFRRRFDLPALTPERRYRLHFGAVNHDARVLVNGRPAGGHFGGNVPFELDITDLLVPGSNELLVAVTTWTAACTAPPKDFVVAKFEHPGWKVPPGTLIAPVGGDLRRTGIWQSVWLESSPEVSLRDVFVRTSVRRHELRATVTVRNDSGQAREVELRAGVEGREGTGPGFPGTRLSLRPGEARQVELRRAWTDPHLWSLDDPYLYRLVATLSEAGEPGDRVTTRFGFREVWTDGPHFVLNGVPMKLFATSGWSMDSWEAARAHVARMKKAGTRIMRLHTQPWQEHILSVADELGLLIADETGVYCYAQSYAPTDRRFWPNFADHVRALARRDRNHPSLVIYSLENEIISCGGDARAWSPKLGRLADILRETDPTRLITCESDLDPGSAEDLAHAGNMDIIGMHYPHEYWSGYTQYPGKCWWMGAPIPYLGLQWQWKRDKPLYLGEFDGGFMAWYPQYQAFWLGDEAYSSKGNYSASSPNSRARREMIQQEVLAYRYYGVTGLNPWFDPDEVDVFGPVAYAPFVVGIREQTHHFTSGEALPRTLILCNDSFARADLRVSWCLSGGGEPARSGHLTVTLEPDSAALRKISLRTPQVIERTPLVLTVVVRQGDRELCRTAQRLDVFPRVAWNLAPPGGLYLYDPGRTAERVLEEAAGHEAAPLADLAQLPADARCVIIGPGALSAGDVPWAQSLAQFVGRGGSVICLAQGAYPKRWLPVETAPDPKHTTTLAFPRCPRHPVLAGISADDLRYWQPDHIVCTGALTKPSRGNFRPLVDAGGIVGSIDDRNGLNWSPLMELPFGAGRYLLCQLPLTVRAADEPIAALLLQRLVGYAMTSAPRSPRSVGLIAPPAGTLRQALDAVGLTYDTGAGVLDRCGVLIAGGGPEAWDALRAQLPALRTWLQAGGVLWLNNLQPAEADLLSELVGSRCELRSADIAAACLTGSDPLTQGLSSHELYWRDRPIWDQWTALRRLMDFEPSTLPAAAVRLTDPPALVRIPVGQGTVLINQVLWDSSLDNRTEGLRLASLLLTNLNAPLDSGHLTPPDEAAFAPVDLGARANLSLAGDPGAGWMGHGPDALAGLPTGKQVLDGGVFWLPEPGEKAVIALRGTARPDYPAEVTGITVGRRAGALHFLHTCAWGGAAGVEAGAYAVRYADGSSVRIPLRVGTELADWYVDPVDLPAAQVAWTGYAADKPGAIGVYAMRWRNPYPDREIATVDFISAQASPVPVLLALSAER